MPDHVHLLVCGLRASSAFKPCITLARQRSAHALRSRFGERLWQDGYVDRLLRRGEEPVTVTGYILNNPVRAGLCSKPGEYPYCWTSRAPD